MARTRDELPEPLQQEDVREDFRRNGSGQWTILYDQVDVGERHTGRYSAVAQPSRRETALSTASWDISIGMGGPGFSQRGFGDAPEVTYNRWGLDDDVEPLVLYRSFHGTKAPYLELVEEFRLLFNLCDDGAGHLLNVEDDASETVVAEIGRSHVRVLTDYLRRFQAVRQLDLLLFIDSVDHGDQELVVSDADAEEEEALLRGTFYIRHLRGAPFSRYLAKRVIPAPARERSGIWPYEAQDDYYPEFIIGVDEHGKPIRYTCNGDVLSNYFGANPGAPHYLTPVYFRREVLQKYYERPNLYTVEDGYLRCASLWGLRMDNDHPAHVMVFLGDLGRDLPSAAERDYWRSFNVLPPDPGMSETAFRRSFLGQFASAQAPDLTFRHRYESFALNWHKRFGWELYRLPAAGDEHLLNGLRVPLSNADPEFEAQMLTMARLLVDFLNDSELRAQLGEIPDNLKSIGKFEMWLEREGYPHTARDIGLLRTIQSLRSKGSAHRKGSEYSQLLSSLGGANHEEQIARLLFAAIDMLEGLSAFFLS